MSWRSILAPVLLIATGCTSLALERSTLNQIQTLSDLRLQVTMDNLAMFANNPSALPSYIVLSAGTAQISDTGTVTGTTIWQRTVPTIQNFNPQGQRNWQQNWTLDPVHDPEILDAMGCAFHWVLDLPDAKCEDCANKLQKFQVLTKLSRIPPGWFHVGKKRDVPKRACYSSCCHGTYVWVTADGLEGLTGLTLILIDLATTDTTSLTPTTIVTKTIKYTDDKNNKKVENCTVMTEETISSTSAPQIGCIGESSTLTMPKKLGAMENAPLTPFSATEVLPLKRRNLYQGINGAGLRGLINLRNR